MMTATADRPCEHGQLIAASLPLATTSQLDKLRTILSELLGRDVALAPMRLPPAYASVWAGYGKIDHIFHNPDWPGPAIELIAHATAHLALGHCGLVRDGGRFASIRSRDQNPVYPGQISTVIHDTGTALHRLFTDAEELGAEHFAANLLRRFGQEPAQDCDNPDQNPVLVCLG